MIKILVVAWSVALITLGLEEGRFFIRFAFCQIILSISKISYCIFKWQPIASDVPAIFDRMKPGCSFPLFTARNAAGQLSLSISTLQHTGHPHPVLSPPTLQTIQAWLVSPSRRGCPVFPEKSAAHRVRNATASGYVATICPTDKPCNARSRRTKTPDKS